MLVSEAVTVWLPEVLKVTLMELLPPLKAVLAGKVACVSEDVR